MRVRSANLFPNPFNRISGWTSGILGFAHRAHILVSNQKWIYIIYTWHANQFTILSDVITGGMNETPIFLFLFYFFLHKLTTQNRMCVTSVARERRVWAWFTAVNKKKEGKTWTEITSVFSIFKYEHKLRFFLKLYAHA